MRFSNHSFKIQALLIICLAFLPVLAVGVVNYMVDPLQIYRKQCWVEPRFWSNQRSQNAGKIRSYLAQDGYDSVIIGNSVADNFLPSQMAKVMGWKKTMKLTVDGATVSEQAFMLEEALSRAPIKNVFWCIRTVNIMGKDKEAWHQKRTVPFYLYTDSPLDDAPYIFSLDNFAFARHLVLGNSKWDSNFDKLNYWQSPSQIKKQIEYNSSRRLQKFYREASGNVCGYKPQFDDKYPSVDQNLIRIIRKYPRVQFFILFAPQTRQSLVVQKFEFLNSQS